MNIFDIKPILSRQRIAKCPMVSDDSIFLEFEQEALSDVEIYNPTSRYAYITYLVKQEYTDSPTDYFKNVYTFIGLNCYETINDLSLIRWEAKDYEGTFQLALQNEVPPTFQLDFLYKNDRYKLSSVSFQ